MGGEVWEGKTPEKRNVQQKLWIKCPFKLQSKREDMSMNLQELGDGKSVEKEHKTVILERKKEKMSPNKRGLANGSANN